MKFYAGIILLLTVLTTTAFAQPIVIGGDSVVCAGDYRIQLRASPAGGVWSGQSITPGGSFYPDTLLLPQRFVRVCYTVGANQECRTFTLKNFPKVDIITADQQICANGVPFRVAVRPALPIGAFGGPISPTGLFSPSPALVGNNTITYTVDTNGCSNDAVMHILVKPAPTGVNIVTTDQQLCSNDPPLAVVATPAPPAGTFGGPIGAGGSFVPSPGLVGTNIITYTVDLNGCKASDTIRIRVRLTPTVNITTNDQEVCANAPDIHVTTTPIGGHWSGSISQAGVFHPDSVLVGINNLTYTLDTNGCPAKDVLHITVKPLPIVNAGPDLRLCSNDKPVRLTGASPAGGTYQGLGGLNVIGDVLTPDTNHVGVNQIRYTYTNPTTGCTRTDFRDVIINRAPRVYAGPDTAVCANAQAFNLQHYFPNGGAWTPANKVSSNGRFTPSNGLTGFNQLFYTASNAITGCKASDTVVVQVIPITTTIDAGRDTSVCANTPAFNLIRSRPAGGYWQGKGIDSATGRFTPSITNTGTQLIRYIIVNDSGCRATDSLHINVRPLPEANAGVDFNACSGNAPVQIGDLPLPQLPPALRYKYKWTGSDGTLGFNKDTISNPFVDFVNGNADSISQDYYLKVTRFETGQPTCFSFDTLHVVIYPKPVARTIPPLKFRGCEGDSILLRAQTRQNLLYQWLNNTTLLTPAPSDSDSVYVARTTGRFRLIVVRNVEVRGGSCADTSTGDSVFIKDRVHPRILGFPGFCRGRSDTLTVDTVDVQNFAYQWLRQDQLTDTTIGPYQILIGERDTLYHASRVGLYSIVLADNRFGVICLDTSEAVRVDSIRTPFVDLVHLGNDSVFAVCSGELPIRLRAPLIPSDPDVFQYLWSDSTTTLFNIIDSIGQYYLRVYNRCGAATDTLTVTSVLPTPTFSILQVASKDTVVCKGINFNLSLGNPGNRQYTWSISQIIDDTVHVPVPVSGQNPQDGIRFNTNVLAPGDTVKRYVVYATSQSPLQKPYCTYTDSALIAVVECEPVVYIPTAFSPDGNNINDKWKLAVYNVQDISILVFNRWGEQVYFYKATDANNDPVAFLLGLDTNSWDGKYKDKELESSAYQYVITYSGIAPGTSETQKIQFKRTGTVTLLR